MLFFVSCLRCSTIRCLHVCKLKQQNPAVLVRDSATHAQRSLIAVTQRC